MKLSDLGSVLGFISDANTIADVSRMLLGKGTPPDESGVKSKAKPWMKGLFSHDDEIEVSKILAELGKTDPEAEAIFYRFLNSKFPKGRNWPSQFANLRTRNAFMRFIVDHRVDHAHRKLSEVTKTDKDGTVTKTITWSTVPSGEPDKALEFIKRCVETIRSAPTEARGRNALLKKLESLNTPTSSNTIANTIEKAASFTDETVKSVDVEMMMRVRELRRNRNPVRRFFDRIL